MRCTALRGGWVSQPWDSDPHTIRTVLVKRRGRTLGISVHNCERGKHCWGGGNPAYTPMFPLGLPRLFPALDCDVGMGGPPASDHKKLSTAISAVKGAISIQESELKR
jgi:hypothetical protein